MRNIVCIENNNLKLLLYSKEILIFLIKKFNQYWESKN